MIIAFLNQKGGVGKTTLSCNVATAFAQVGESTLLIDDSKIINHINARQKTGGRLESTDLASALVACKSAVCRHGKPYFSHDLMLCRGHDIMEILAIGFRYAIGSRSASASSTSEAAGTPERRHISSTEANG